MKFPPVTERQGATLLDLAGRTWGERALGTREGWAEKKQGQQTDE